MFQENPLLGLLDLDLLLTLDYLVMIPFYLALYVVVRRVAPAWGLLALMVGLFSLVLFVVSREATFSMWMLSDQYAAATSAADKAALLAAGRTLLTLYNGGTFATSYILGAISTLIFSAMMVRHHIFGRLPGLVGVLTGLTMLVPANAGPVGLTIAMVSLLPTAAWLILLSLTCSASHGNTRRTTPRTRRGYRPGSTTHVAPVTYVAAIDTGVDCEGNLPRGRGGRPATTATKPWPWRKTVSQADPRVLAVIATLLVRRCCRCGSLIGWFLRCISCFGRRWRVVSSSPMPLSRLAPIASRALGGWWRRVGFGRAVAVA